ncbi:MAG: DNA-binding response regulator [Sphingobacteriaceae bacterium]|nr:DNA-binding response regulator [Sphingobacteriaceae bacterium]
MNRILLVEDDPNFGLVLKDYLELHDYEVVLCTNGLQGQNAFKNGRFDLCILDVMMPEMDGFSLAKIIRTQNTQVPLFFLTAKNLKNDVVQGFELGADDYITKPFDSELLLCKIKAIIHRVQTAVGPLPQRIQLGHFQFDAALRELTIDGQTHRLSPKEAELLQLFASQVNKVVSRSEALQRIWKDDNYFTGRSMDVYVTKLRKYLAADPSVEIINLHGNGFRLVAPLA